jgi:hypothetical protein
MEKILDMPCGVLIKFSDQAESVNVDFIRISYENNSFYINLTVTLNCCQHIPSN